MAIFRLNLSKTINTGTDNNCSISVEANSAYEDINENFEIAMELFNSLKVIDCHTEGKKEAEGGRQLSSKQAQDDFNLSQ